MLENYRSTRQIIDAANAVIDAAQDRLKVDHVITIDRVRTMEPAGGTWQGWDLVAQGRVQVIPAGQGDATQAHRALDEFLRLSELDPGWDWARTAVVARQWDTLEVMRAVCRERGMETQMAQEDFTASWQLRETQALLEWIDAQEQGVTAEEALAYVNAMPGNRWTELLAEAMETMEEETGSDRIPRAAAREWIAEWARGNRRRQHALLLTTAHRAKGLEFDHVVILDGNWQHRNQNEAEEQRRLYYVAMTRARHTLTLMNADSGNPLLRSLTGHESVLFREPPQHASIPAPEPAEIRPEADSEGRRPLVPRPGQRRPCAGRHQGAAARRRSHHRPGQPALGHQNPRRGPGGQVVPAYPADDAQRSCWRRGSGNRRMGRPRVQPGVQEIPAEESLGGRGAGAYIPPWTDI